MRYSIFDNHNISEIDQLKAVIQYAADKLVDEVMKSIQDSNHDWCLDYAIVSCTAVSIDVTTVYVTLTSGRSDTIGHLTVKHTRAGCWEIRTPLDRISAQYFDTAMEYVIYDQLK